mmetsp:Transcript_33634/g.73409  ORF Transcript_33634/g.73409 Transcript_33634/m.73409 type:complete len:499 (-) Transcript_33634:7397-8893(-)
MLGLAGVVVRRAEEGEVAHQPILQVAHAQLLRVRHLLLLDGAVARSARLSVQGVHHGELVGHRLSSGVGGVILEVGDGRSHGVHVNELVRNLLIVVEHARDAGHEVHALHGHLLATHQLALHLRSGEGVGGVGARREPRDTHEGVGGVDLRDGGIVSEGAVLLQGVVLPQGFQGHGQVSMELVAGLVQGQGAVITVETVVGDEAVAEDVVLVGPAHHLLDRLLRYGDIVDHHLVHEPVEELLGEHVVREVHAEDEGAPRGGGAHAGPGGSQEAVQVHGHGAIRGAGEPDLVPLVGRHHNVAPVCVLHQDIVHAVIVVVEAAGVAALVTAPLQDGIVEDVGGGVRCGAKGHNRLHSRLGVGEHPQPNRVLAGGRRDLGGDVIRLHVVLGGPAVGAAQRHLKPLVLRGAGVPEHRVQRGNGAALLAVADLLHAVDGPVRRLVHVAVALIVHLVLEVVAGHLGLGAVALRLVLHVAPVVGAPVGGEHHLVHAHATRASKVN